MEQGYIFLTDEGKEIAEMIYERHEFLTKWLTSLGVDGAVAAEDACRIEHVISKESFEAIKKAIHMDDWCICIPYKDNVNMLYAMNCKKQFLTYVIMIIFI